MQVRMPKFKSNIILGFQSLGMWSLCRGEEGFRIEDIGFREEGYGRYVDRGSSFRNERRLAACDFPWAGLTWNVPTFSLRTKLWRGAVGIEGVFFWGGSGRGRVFFCGAWAGACYIFCCLGAHVNSPGIVVRDEERGKGRGGRVVFFCLAGGTLLLLLLLGRGRGLHLTFLLNIKLWRKPFSIFH